LATSAISIHREILLPNDQLEEMDRWMLERTAELARKMPRVGMPGMNFHRVYHAYPRLFALWT